MNAINDDDDDLPGTKQDSSRQRFALNLARDMVKIIHELEKIHQELIELENQLKNACNFFQAGNCHASSLGNECLIFGLTCKEYNPFITPPNTRD